MSGDSGDRSSAFASESVPDEYERHLVPTVFAQWAEVLLDAAVVAPGSRVLDIASGTGALARAVSRRTGSDGHVVASDISTSMLARAAAVGAAEGAAPIEYVEASADALPFEDERFDLVLCQQGLQFFPQRAASVREMRRVLRPGGVAGIAVWATGHPLEPFGVYGEELAAVGAESPFPGAFDADTFTMSLDTVQSLLEDAGFSTVDASVVELEVSWPHTASVVAGVLGTPYGPLVRRLSPDLRRRFEAALEKRYTPEEPSARVRRRTAAVIARATVA